MEQLGESDESGRVVGRQISIGRAIALSAWWTTRRQ